MSPPRLPSRLARIALVASIGWTAQAHGADPHGASERGRALFTDMGCYECHGYSGQGAPGAGPPLAPDPMGAIAFHNQVRKPRALMPPYGAAILPDDQLDDIYAYVASIPAGRSPDRIPQLAIAGAPPAPPAAADPTRGAAVYATSCASCHGAAREGQSAPSLRAEAVKRSLASTVELVKSPPPGMPKLYPGRLSQDDVAAVAAYVRQGG